MRVGIIGHGTLGGAIADGLRASPRVSSLDTTTRRTSARNSALVRNSDVVLLCVKPHDVEPALSSIAGDLTGEHVLISTAASVGTSDLRSWTQGRARIVRAMPNTPARAGAAMTVLARDTESCDGAIATAELLFSSLGRTIVMHEAQMDAVTAISGCGPAYVFVMIEAMIDAALALGIQYSQARELVAQTVLGSAQLVLTGDAHPAQLRTAVATPAGKTIRGLIALEEGKFRATVTRAVCAGSQSAERSFPAIAPQSS